MKFRAYVLIETLDDIEAQVEALVRPYDNYFLDLLLAGKDIPAKMEQLGVTERSEFERVFDAHLKKENVDVSYLLFENGNYYDCIETHGGYFNWYDIVKHDDEIKPKNYGLAKHLENVVCKVEDVLSLNEQYVSAIVSKKASWQDYNDHTKENADGTFDSTWATKRLELLNQHKGYFAVEVRCGD